MTPVVFRKYKDEVVAILPTLSAHYGNVVCYQHVGQHGEGHLSWVSDTLPATPAEYGDLLRELVAIGYDDLKVYKRLQTAHISWRSK